MLIPRILPQAGLNSEFGALQGNGSRANVTIGRAIKLVLQNIGGAKLGGTESSTLGSPAKISLCVAEREEKLTAGWSPRHVELGYDRGASVVSVLPTAGGTSQLVEQRGFRIFIKDPIPLIHVSALIFPSLVFLGQFLQVDRR